MTLCARADELLAWPAPDEALGMWLQSIVAFGATKRGLSELLRNSMRDGTSNLASCMDALRTAGGALLTRAQDAGVVRRDADISDVLKLSHALGWVIESGPEGAERSELFLRILVDGLRHREPAST